MFDTKTAWLSAGQMRSCGRRKWSTRHCTKWLLRCVWFGVIFLTFSRNNKIIPINYSNLEWNWRLGVFTFCHSNLPKNHPAKHAIGQLWPSRLAVGRSDIGNDKILRKPVTDSPRWVQSRQATWAAKGRGSVAFLLLRHRLRLFLFGAHTAWIRKRFIIINY